MLETPQGDPWHALTSVDQRIISSNRTKPRVRGADALGASASAVFQLAAESDVRALVSGFGCPHCALAAFEHARVRKSAPAGDSTS